MKIRLVLATLALLGGTAFAVVPLQDGGTSEAPANQEPAAPVGALERLLASLAAEGIQLDLGEGHVSIEAHVLVRDQLLEYLLVGPGGATHESLFISEVKPSLLNAAFLALGASPGRNANWVEIPRPADAPEGARPEFRIVPPSGDGFYLHVAWREGEEIYFFRVEDLIANLETGRAMRRGPLVFLGSRMAVMPHLQPEGDESEPEEVFVADIERNLFNLIYFSQGNTLLTASHGETNRQDVWAANVWNLPESGSSVRLILSRKPLTAAPASLVEALPAVVRSDGQGAR